MLRIEKQNAILAWNKTDAVLNQSGNGRLTLDIETTKPALELRTKKPQILIDQSQPFAEAGLKNIQAFMEESVNFAKQTLLEGIGRIVSDGNQWIDIHTGIDPIPDQAIYNAYEMFDKEFNFGMIPQSRPKIDVDMGTVDTQFKKGEVINRSKPQKVDMQYAPWRMDYYMKQYQSIRFSYETPQLNLRL